MKQSNKSKRMILWIAISLVGIGILSVGGYYGYRLWIINQFNEYYVSLKSVSKFEDFSSIEGDFQIVADMVVEHETDINNSSIQLLLIDVTDDGVSTAGVYKRTLEGDRVQYFELNEDEEKAINTVFFAFQKCSPTYLNSVFFINDNDMIFLGDDGYYAMVYSVNDKPNKSDIKGYMGKNAVIVKLDRCWYQVGRVD